jgi:metalloendopeptidase OMA1, mitochondrial
MSRPGALVRRLVVLLFTVFAGAAPLALTSCQTSPVTGRSELILIGSDQEMQLGVQAYQEALSQARLSSDQQKTEMVRRVGSRIAAAAMADNPSIKDFKWEFNLIEDDKTVNAWCLPGGKVAVYTGILPVTQTEGGLATVLGHEIAHATAHHGAERISQGILLQTGQEALGAAFSNKDSTTATAVMAALGLGAQLGVQMPFSRKQESEADHIGLVYMARAGYDPKESLEFWKRMETMAGANQPPQFLSDHPSHGVRVKQIQDWLPEAQKEFKPEGSGSAPVTPTVIQPPSQAPAGKSAPPSAGSSALQPKRK